MRKLIVFLLCAAMFLLPLLYKTGAFKSMDMSQIPPQILNQWNSWKTEYGKSYSSNEEESYRMTVFYMNMMYIQSNQGKTFTLGPNQFMDLTNDEWKSIYLSLVLPKNRDNSNAADDMEVPNASLDWRTKGAVQAVKNQGQCGSCWAFSAVAALESHSFISGTGLGNFSEQQLVDCSDSYGNQGCNGGWMDQAFAYVRDHGIVNESEYPYVARDQNCKIDEGPFKISGYTDVPKSCSSLKDALDMKPISVAVDASRWSFYQGGVFSQCSTQVDHGVLLIGYEDAGNWIIKNSWGPTWGEKGFIRLAPGNTCAVCNYASYPNK